MSNLLRGALEKRKQYLINQLVSFGVYPKSCKNLSNWTLSDLEQEYQFIRKVKKL